MFEKVPNWFKDLPTGRKLIGEANAQETKTRRAIVDEIAALERRLVVEHPPLAKKCDEARERVEAAVKVLAEARRAYQEAVSARDGLADGIEVMVAQRRMALRRSADAPPINAFCEELRDLLEQARYSLPVTHSDKVETMAGTRRHAKETNRHALERFRDGMRAALQEADALYEAADYDVTAAIARIRASLPSLKEAQETMEKVG
jgi:hypothetical protein